jgi:hypothetical protein
MKNPFETRLAKSLLAALLMPALLLLTTRNAGACACGCGTYNVGTSYNFPNGPGGLVWTEYDYIGQSQNWSGLGPAGADNNPHKLIQTSWLQGGMQYFWNNKWGASLIVPSANRIVRAQTENGVEVQQGAPAAAPADGEEAAPAQAPSKPTVATKQWWSMGDIRLNGYYTGFSPDMSTGVNLGMKFATGNWTVPDIDRDNQIGTGSTDILCGFFHRHRLTMDEKWSWFVNAQLDAPVITQGGYTPGLQVNSTAGVYYTGLKLGGVKIRPLGQVLFTNRASDSGPAADPQNTGYQQLSLSPGIEFDFKKVRLYADAELPVMNNVVGNQLIAPCTVKVVASYMF